MVTADEVDAAETLSTLDMVATFCDSVDDGSGGAVSIFDDVFRFVANRAAKGGAIADADTQWDDDIDSRTANNNDIDADRHIPLCCLPILMILLLYLCLDCFWVGIV